MEAEAEEIQKKEFEPKSSVLNRLMKRIDNLKTSLDSPILDDATKQKIQDTINQYQQEYDVLKVKVSAKEKMLLESGTFYLEIPTDDKRDLYEKLWETGMKVKWTRLNDKTRAITNTSGKLKRIYDIYVNLLIRKGVQQSDIPAFESISGKINNKISV